MTRRTMLMLMVKYLLVAVVSLQLHHHQCNAAAAMRRPSALYVFGDSLVDVGMNNNITSFAKANFLPNGIDYPPGQKPTGRFCNGRIISDFLAEHWGLEPALAYDDPNNKGDKLLLGANFASAGGGILDDTGRIFIQRFGMNQQVQLFGEYLGKLTELVGGPSAAEVVSGGLYSITIGANDFLDNYYLPISPRRGQVTLSQFQSLLISQLENQVKSIYQLGARKIVIAGLGPIGCIPLLIGQRFLTDKGKCIAFYQNVAITFNTQLKSLSERLQQELSGSNVLYSNGFDMVLDMINNPAAYGFENVNTACCGKGPNRGVVPCRPSFKVCSDRSAYIFWDPFHPTEAVNAIVSRKVLFGPPSDISPINLSQLFGG